MYLFRHPAFDPSNCLSTYLSFSHLFSVFCLPTSPPFFSVTKLWIYLHSHWSIFISFHFSIGLLISLSLSHLSVYLFIPKSYLIPFTFIHFFLLWTHLSCHLPFCSVIHHSIHLLIFILFQLSFCLLIHFPIYPVTHPSVYLLSILSPNTVIYLLTHSSFHLLIFSVVHLYTHC